MTETENREPVGEFVTLVYVEGTPGSTYTKRELVGRASVITIEQREPAGMTVVLGMAKDDGCAWEFTCPTQRVLSSLVVATHDEREPAAMIVDYPGHSDMPAVGLNLPLKLDDAASQSHDTFPTDL